MALPLAFAASALLAYRFSRPGSRLYILDHPNDRSLHRDATPRTGGVAILAGIAVGGGWLAATIGLPASLLWPGIGVILLALVGLVDDISELGPLPRLMVQFIAAWPLLDLLPAFPLALPYWAGAVLLLVGAVWMVNLYNFMDGMDGFAGGMGVIGFGSLGILAWQGGGGVAWACGVIALSCVGFLVRNFPPANIFMGDAGATVLGFLAALISLWGVAEELFSFWSALLIFSPFVVDASYTLLRRALRGERVWRAHREHLYQRLVLLGWGHRRTVLAEYALMLLCAAAGLALPRLAAQPRGWLLAGIGLMYLALILGVNWGTAHRNRGREASD